jgi:hypothetical protein
MQKGIIVALFLLSFSSSFSQISSQKKLVEQYFSNSGGSILQDLAHPACTWSDATVKSFADHSYYITLHYTQVLTSEKFDCEYKLQLDFMGKFISLKKIECKCPDFNCFGLCRFADFPEITTAYDRARYEKYMGKSLNYMTCEEYTTVKLYFQWEDYGYYKKY